ncbi:hypothetical protein F0Q45_25265 [Mycobacterium simiae]|uniref:YbaB/EbfC family nucleoid-associated protein n=1 Tax=Mycobacterium simiae TaxID=1784 RepID=A0A5B1B8F5_MYCSI|nr:YbaB/EbfC family nucleoid-associated protein [Mycobacterium simiae]KAA1243950.1 hypothetical protein F0Q45_25265 [Mycobacterium simiae]
MTDDEYVAAIEQGLRVTRARIAQFHAALQQAVELDPIGDLVRATLDADGYLSDLSIDPTALTGHTHTELEELITEVLRASNLRLREAAQEAIDRYFAKGSSSWQDLKALGEDW